MPRSHYRLTLGAMMLSTSSAAFAQTYEGASNPAPPPPAPPSYDTSAMATGDWGGLRTDLHDRGVDFNVGYNNEFAANLQGGRRKDASATGQLTLDLKLDAQKLFGLRGGTFETVVSYRHGSSLSDKAGLTLLQQTQENYGGGQTWRLTEFSYKQRLAPGLDLKLGRLNMSSDFASFGCEFENLTFCGGAPGNIAYTYWHNFPLSQWGAVLRLQRPTWYAMVGAYASNKSSYVGQGFFSFARSGPTGVTVPVEFGWMPRLGPAGLPGTYKIGGWYNADSGPDALLDIHHQPAVITGMASLERTGRVGGYASFTQQITGRAEESATGVVTTHGLSAFGHIIQLDDKTSRVDNQMAIGLTYTGALGFRPHDEIALAVGSNHINQRAALSDQLASGAVERAHTEYAAELYYGLHATRWLIVRPNLQYIVHPGGYAHADDVVVTGIKTSITL
jgi:porin